MFDFINNFFAPKVQNLGVIRESVTPEKVYDFSEVVAMAAQPLWIEKDRAKWRKFPEQFQSSSSACVAFTTAKIALILYYLRTGVFVSDLPKVKFSPGWYYRQRTPKSEGMRFSDIQKLASEGGMLEALMPSEGIGEFEINQLKEFPFHKEVSKAFAISDVWVELPIDFDTVASTIQKTNKGIMLWFKFGKGEWFRQAIPKHLGTSQDYLHSVTGIDAFLYKGVENILIEDSADSKPEFGHQKLITRDFFNRHCILARYPLNFRFDAVLKPVFDGSIVSAQKCLQFEGVFPTNVPYAENIGPITRDSLKKFQTKYGIIISGELDLATRKKLQELYH